MPNMLDNMHPFFFGPRSHFRTASLSSSKFKITASEQSDSATRLVIKETGVQADHASRFMIREEDNFTN